jgi:hypothetical protein
MDVFRLTEIERAEAYADDLIDHYERVSGKFRGWCPPILDPEFINEDRDFQEMVIQHIRIKGNKVYRHGDIYELCLRLEKEVEIA